MKRGRWLEETGKSSHNPGKSGEATKVGCWLSLVAAMTEGHGNFDKLKRGDEWWERKRKKAEAGKPWSR